MFCRLIPVAHSSCVRFYAHYSSLHPLDTHLSPSRPQSNSTSNMAAAAASTTLEFDVIVIGAGIMGSSAAYYTAKRGHRTLLLDRFDFLHHRGSSHGESRTIRAAYPEPHYAAMVLRSSHLWSQSQSDAGYTVYNPSPHLDLGQASSPTLRSIITSCEGNSVGVRILDHVQTMEKFEGRVEIPEGWIAVISDVGGVVKPSKAVAMFQSLALRYGAVLRDNVEVRTIEGIEGGDGVVVYGSDGERFRGKKCVIVAGAWTKELVRSVAGVEIPITPLETTVCYWRIKEGFEEGYSLAGGFPSFSSCGNPYVYGTPSLEFPGLIKVAVHGGGPCDPDKRTWAPGPGSVDKLREWVEARFAGRVESDRPVMTQSCMYSMTPDEDFVIDFLGGKFGEDVVVAGGFSGHGFKMGPIIGKVLADMVIDGKTGEVDMRHFRLGRFKENPNGNVKEIGVHTIADL